MSKTIKFYGASDDLIEVEGSIPGCDEYPGESGEFVVAGLRVEVDYMATGTWAIRVGQVDESVSVTATDIALSVEPDGYTMVLSMTVPDGSHVSKVAVIR